MQFCLTIFHVFRWHLGSNLQTLFLERYTHLTSQNWVYSVPFRDPSIRRKTLDGPTLPASERNCDIQPRRRNKNFGTHQPQRDANLDQVWRLRAPSGAKFLAGNLHNSDVTSNDEITLFRGTMVSKDYDSEKWVMIESLTNRNFTVHLKSKTHAP